MSILVYIFFIVNILGALGTTQKIRIMGSLQVDDLFIADS